MPPDRSWEISNTGSDVHCCAGKTSGSVCDPCSMLIFNRSLTCGTNPISTEFPRQRPLLPPTATTSAHPPSPPTQPTPKFIVERLTPSPPLLILIADGLHYQPTYTLPAICGARKKTRWCRQSPRSQTTRRIKTGAKSVYNSRNSMRAWRCLYREE